MNILNRIFTEMCARFHLVDAYLAECRDNREEAAYYKHEAYKLRQQLALERMEIRL